MRLGKRKIVIALSVITLIPLLAIGAINFFAPKPPAALIEDARKAIASAKKYEANVYATTQLKLAEDSWNKAMADWQLNNSKNPVRRNYSKTSVLAKKAIEFAKEAQTRAIESKKELHVRIVSSLKDLRESAKFIEMITGKLPLNHGIRKKLTPAKLKLDEIESAFNRHDLMAAKKYLESNQKTISELKKQTLELLTDYFSGFNQWQRDKEEMRQWSLKNNSVSLVVDKFSRKCYVYNAGKVIKEIEVELGVNWLGDKQQRGDRATPEGKYKIIAKKSGRNTIYHKALLINFPNEEDKRRFEREKARGNIPRSAHIGGSIEIHGGGGKGIDWTEGCVALENTDMDKLFALCSVGTPLAIVGSLQPLEEIIGTTDK